MNAIDRKKMVLAMEYIVRNVSNEECIDGWFMCGVADGDIEYGENNPDMVEDYYIEDVTFRDLMDEFLRTIRRACNDGGLYCDGVSSNEG